LCVYFGQPEAHSQGTPKSCDQENSPCDALDTLDTRIAYLGTGGRSTAAKQRRHSIGEHRVRTIAGKLYAKPSGDGLKAVPPSSFASNVAGVLFGHEIVNAIGEQLGPVPRPFFFGQVLRFANKSIWRHIND
jgi:hypothetical protein